MSELKKISIDMKQNKINLSTSKHLNYQLKGGKFMNVFLKIKNKLLKKRERKEEKAFKFI